MSRNEFLSKRRRANQKRERDNFAIRQQLREADIPKKPHQSTRSALSAAGFPVTGRGRGDN